MNYMTPDLLARFRSQDDAAAERAATEWENACAEYNSHLDEIQPSLPGSVRKLLRPQASLHDAKVLMMAADEVPHFSIVLELSNPHNPKNKNLELKYRLVGGIKGGFRLLKHPALAGDGKPLGWWLYDEFAVADLEKLTAFTHSILLTGGFELQLSFFSLCCRRLSFFIPPATLSGEEVDALELLVS